MDAAVAALLGAAIGVAGSFGTAWLQQRHQTKRERIKLATDLAIADFNETLSRVKMGGGGPMPPLSLFIAYHADVLDAMAENSFDAERIAAIETRQKVLYAAFPLRYKPDAGGPGRSTI